MIGRSPLSTLYFSFNSLNNEINSKENLIAENENSLLESVNQSDVKSYKENETEDNKKDNKDADKEANSTSKVDTPKENADNKTDKEETKETSKENENKQNSDDKAGTKETSILNDQNFSLFDDTKEMTWPVFGQIVMDYSMETAVYDKTLEQYRTNDSIAISAEEGTEVLAAAEGVIERVYADVEDGNTVVINHGNGWASTYSQLQDNVLVAVGQVIAEGEVIGNVGTPSNYSVNLGPHLDFKITKDNVSTDPKLVLAEIEE